jgi:hypothetical protein
VPRAQSLILAGAAATVVFFAASPFLLVEPGAFLRDVTGNRDIVMRASAHAGLFASLPDYLAMLWRDAAGGRTIAVAALAGLAVTCVNYRRPLVMLLSFAVPFLLFISNTAPATRYLNPLLPIMALFAALPLSLIGASASAAARRGRLVGMAYLIVVGTPILLASVGQDQFFNATDTRTLAQAFIEHQIPAGASVLLQPYSVPLRQSREGLVESLRENLGSETRATIKYRSRLALDPYPTPGYRTIYLGEFSAGSRAAGNDPDKIYISPATVTGAMGLAPLRARGVDYVVLKYNGVDPSLQPLLGALSREALLLAEFSPYRSAATEAVRARVPPFVHNADARIDAALERPGPVIRIWRITK